MRTDQLTTSGPQFAIGERAILLQTDRGNVLWDLITYLDTATVEFINSLGGLSAIVISHPHYYTTHLEWARAFNCPVYISEEDKEWICCSSLIGGKVSSKSDKESFEYGRRFIPAETRDFEVLPGVRAVKTGGHFPGSLVLLWEETQRLLIADTFLIVPSGRYHINRPPGTSSFAFMWSIPNMIPLAPDDILGIWKALEGIHFTATHGAFVGMDIRGEGDEIKRRVLESMKIQTRASGHENHALLRQTV
ncbi:MAG: hypothetical protein M4579_004379 [Chaenotheca gracillima]|nr:MAG: hypothetical protein M4579_004379 [Chaenotheca gracillima]